MRSSRPAALVAGVAETGGQPLRLLSAMSGHRRPAASSWWIDKFALSVLAGPPQASLGLDEIIPLLMPADDI